jgi:hypothetical protein
MDVIHGVNLALATAEPAQTEAEIEAKLKNEIQSLWAAHQVRSATAKHTKEELRTLRLDLGRKLFEMKSMLSRCGRAGGWAAYLRANALPRSSADRFVGRHETSLTTEIKRLGEAIPETTAEDVRRLVRGLLPRLRRVLTTPSWVEWFLVEVEYQLQTVNASSTGGRVDEAGAVAQGDSTVPIKTEVAPLTHAA